MNKLEYHNHALQRELVELKQARVSSSKVYDADVSGSQVEEIALGRQTGGFDDDRFPGDEALLVMLEPRDGDGHAIKAPGKLQVTALEILPGGIKKPLSSWNVSPPELRQKWKTGLLSTGYEVILPWEKLPRTKRMRVIAQFITPDGRMFETDKDVRLRLIEEKKHLPKPPPEIIPDEGIPLPPPRPLRDSEAPKTGPSIEPANWWKVPRTSLHSSIKLLKPIAMD